MSDPPETLHLAVPPLRQPDDVSCGPTCLVKVLRHFGDERPFEDVERLVERNEDGGTFGVYLGHAGLRMGYRATIYSYNLRVFDPTWAELGPERLLDKLDARRARTREGKLNRAIEGYAAFLRAGGRVRFEDLSPALLVSILQSGCPIVVGLSATYLYQTPREDPITNAFDDVGGQPSGHFLVVCGYRHHGREFVVSDPYSALPMTAHGTYEVSAQRLLNAILLGDVTYDGVLLVLEPEDPS